MKRIKYLFVLIFSLFLFSGSVLASSSKFTPTVNMEPDITENQVNVVLGFKGEEVMAVRQTFSYDSSRLELDDIYELDNFVLTKGAVTENGKWRTITFLVDSEYSFEDTNYAVITFNVIDKFKIGKTADVFYYNYEAVGSEKIKYRDPGYLMTMNRDTSSEMYFALDEIDKAIKVKYWILEHIWLFVIIFLVITGVIVLITLLPSKRKKENRAKSVEEQRQAENYNPDLRVKINQSDIDKIGNTQKPVDLSQAIEVSNIKPFGDASGKFDAPQDNSQVQGTIQMPSQVQAPVAPMQQMQQQVQHQGFMPDLGPEEPTNVVSNNEPVLNAFNITPEAQNQVIQNASVQSVPTITEAQPTSPVQSAPQADVAPFDPTGMAPVEQAAPSPVQTAPVIQPIAPITNMTPLSQEDGITDLDNQENLTLFQPTIFEDGSNETNNVNSSNGGINMMGLILALIVSISVITASPVRALDIQQAEGNPETTEVAPETSGEEVTPEGETTTGEGEYTQPESEFTQPEESTPEETSKYRIDDLRNYLVGNIPYDAELDYNDDKKVDIVDIVYTRATVGVNYHDLINEDPGFAAIHGQSSNLIGFATTTTARTKSTKKTTKAGGVAGTTKGPRTTTEKTTRETTTKAPRTTTTRSSRTTTEKTTRETTTRSTTVKSTTTRSTTVAQTYNVSVSAVNGSVSGSSTASVKGGGTASFKFTPNNGYIYDAAGVKCDNAVGSYTSSTNTLTVKSFKDNTTCTVTFVKKTFPVKFLVSPSGTGTVSETQANVDSGGSKSVTISPNAGYEVTAFTCNNNQSASLSGNTGTISGVSNVASCTFKLQQKKYTITVNYNGANYRTADILHDTDFAVTASQFKGKTCSCSGSNYTFDPATGKLVVKATAPTTCNIN